MAQSLEQEPAEEASVSQESKCTEDKPSAVRVKNRRKRYLDLTPSYFTSPNLELADPLLYDRLVRRFQTAAEREADGRAKGFSGVLQADLYRSEAKIVALANPNPHATFTYTRGPYGEILEESEDERPRSKEEGWERWRWEMEMRFVRGADDDFEYRDVDENPDFDDRNEEDRVALEQWLGGEEPEWIREDSKSPQGETGIQDF
jgi:coiled-coil protein DUF2052